MTTASISTARGTARECSSELLAAALPRWPATGGRRRGETAQGRSWAGVGPRKEAHSVEREREKREARGGLG